MAALAVVVLAACTPPAPVARFDPASRPPLPLPVASISVDDRRQPLPQSNFIDERRGNELTAQVRRWLETRLRAEGSTGSATAIIERGSLTERLRSDRQGGVLGAVSNEATWDLDGNVGVRLVVEGRGEPGTASATVGRTRSVDAGASVGERDAAADRLTADLLRQLDQALERAVQDNIGRR